MAYEFIRNTEKLTATKALLKQVGKDAIMALPHSAVYDYLVSKRDQHLEQAQFIHAKELRLAAKVEARLREREDIAALKSQDLALLGRVTPSLAGSNLLNTQGYEAIQVVVGYGSVDNSAEVLLLEQYNCKKLYSIQMEKVRELNVVIEKLTNITNFITEVRQFLEALNRHGIDISYIINLDVEELKHLLESGVAEWGT